MFELVQSFLRQIAEGDPPSHVELLGLVDQLIVSYHSIPASEPAEVDYNPPSDNTWYQRLAARFPDLGYYPHVSPDEPYPGKTTCGDAIDDLADIARDLEEYIWRRTHVSVDDANWHLKFLFECHWGRHARDLASYLHAKELN